MYSKHNPRVIDYIEFVNRLPLSREGKIQFTKKYVEVLKTYEEEVNNNKKYYENEVLPLIISGPK